LDPEHFALYQPIETSPPISKEADKTKQNKEHVELRKKAALDPRHIRNKERLQAATELAEKTTQARAEARQKQESNQEEWVPTHRKKTVHSDNPTPKNPAAARIFNPWSQPRRVVSKPAQPTGSDKSSNPNQFPAPPHGHKETEETAQPSGPYQSSNLFQFLVPPQDLLVPPQEHTEMAAEQTSTPPPEDQSTCHMQTDAEYGSDLPSERKEEINDDDI
jgi:hypothetical protein